MLNSAVARRSLAERSPLIFLNACRSAGAAPEYTQMMGWAGQFTAAGAGAFVGTLWPVSSSRASAFAEVFYADLVAGNTLGAACLHARQATEDSGDPTWLAYTTYGDPGAVAKGAPKSRPVVLQSRGI
jgi:CHAT domain-containing protein